MSSDVDPMEDTAKIETDRNGHCGKSPTGFHEWEEREGYSRCKHCGAITDQRLLLG